MADHPMWTYMNPDGQESVWLRSKHDGTWFLGSLTLPQLPPGKWGWLGLSAECVDAVLEAMAAKQGDVRDLPKELRGRMHNGSACDLLLGPCACHAWHMPEEILARLARNGVQL